MNEQNLIPMLSRKPEERRALGRLGGLASGRRRREKASMRATLKKMLYVMEAYPEAFADFYAQTKSRKCRKCRL